MRIALFIFFLSLSACAGARLRPEAATDTLPWPLHLVQATGAPIAEPEGELDLPTALALTLSHHPQLQGAADLERLRAARIRAARVAPNPTLELTAEDLLGSGPFRGVGGSQWTLTVSQVIELGGKPEARAALAGAQHGVEAAQVRLTRLAVLSTVALDFARLVHLQERRSNLAARLENAAGLEQAIAARVEAGKDSALQLRQYQLQLTLSRFDLQELDRAVTAARARLASHWGAREPRFRVAVGRFSMPRSLPSPAELRERLHRHPDLAARKAQIAQLRAQRELERRLATPDVELTLGARMVAEDRDAAMVGGISLPLPLWDRRREAVDTLDAQVRVAEREAAAQVFLLGQQVDRLIAELDRNRAELVLLEETVLPEMETNLGLFREGFAMGRFTILEMLETQRALFELRERILTARLALQTAVLELEFLTGVRLESGGAK